MIDEPLIQLHFADKEIEAGSPRSLMEFKEQRFKPKSIRPLSPGLLLPLPPVASNHKWDYMKTQSLCTAKETSIK